MEINKRSRLKITASSQNDCFKLVNELSNQKFLMYTITFAAICQIPLKIAICYIIHMHTLLYMYFGGLFHLLLEVILLPYEEPRLIMVISMSFSINNTTKK